MVVLRRWAAAASLLVALAVAAPTPIVQLDALGAGVRVRVAPPGGAIVDPPLSALLGGLAPTASAITITNANLFVTADPATGLITATRISDGVMVLAQEELVWGPPAVGSRPGSVSVQVRVFPTSVL